MMCMYIFIFNHPFTHSFIQKIFNYIPNHLLCSILGSEITRKKLLCSQRALRLVRYQDKQSRQQVVNAALRACTCHRRREGNSAKGVFTGLRKRLPKVGLETRCAGQVIF